MTTSRFLRTEPSEVLRALRLILEPGQVTELRAFASKRPLVVGYFDTDHLEDLAKAATSLDRASGVYFVPNVVNPALLSRAANRTKPAGEVEATKDVDITRRRWLLVDCDPKRPAGIPSTDEEHAAALKRCEDMRIWLRSRAWPDPIFADSGNGAHLLYRVDLPAEDEGLVDRMLKALGARFTDALVDVDQAVKNPSRIWKLYGTPARKGDSTEERPHRLSRLLDVPEALDVVPLTHLEALAAQAPISPVLPPPRPPSSPSAPRVNGHVSGTSKVDQARRYLERVEGAVADGTGENATFRVCGLVTWDFDLTPEEAMDAMADWNARSSPPWEPDALRAKLENAAKYGGKGRIRGGKLRDTSRPSSGPRREEPPHPADTADDMGRHVAGLAPEPPAPAVAVMEEGDGEEGAEEGRALPAGPLPADEVREFLRWRYTSTGPKLERTGGNLAKILRLDARWGRRLAVNEMTQDLLFDGEVVPDSFADRVQEQIEDSYGGASFGADEVYRKVKAQADTNPQHPVRQWLEALPAWDEVERLFHVPEDILGVTDDLAGHYFRHWAIAAVRRVFNPGEKFDCALVLVGFQGKGKSTFWEALAGEWFCDTPIDLDSKDRFQQLAAAWIVELPEIDWQTYAKTAEALKAFLSARVDRFRPPYGKSVVTVRRSSVCVGSTNKEEFLTDPTGSRRFWPVAVPDGGEVNIPALRSMREQLWAEALHLHRQGVPHWLPRELDDRRAVQAERFTVEDTWEALVFRALDTWKRERIAKGEPIGDGLTTADVMIGMGLPAFQHSRQATNRVRDQLRKLRWVSQQVQIEGDRRWRWCPPLTVP